MSSLSYQTNDVAHIYDFNASLDRIDSSKDYTTDNTQLVCWIVNRMKSDFSMELFIKVTALIYQYNYKKINNLAQELMNNVIIPTIYPFDYYT